MKIADGTVIDPELPDLSAEGRAVAHGKSAGCRHCGGEGLVIVDARSLEARVRSCAATCECTMGRWLRAWHGRASRDLLARLPELAAVRSGTDRRWRYEEGDYEPGPAAHVPTRQQINALFRRPT